MSEAEAFNEQIQVERVSEADGRRRDGDYLHGQIIGASYVLDKIGAPSYDGRYTLTVGQRVEAYLKKRGIVNENGTLPPSGHTRESRL